MPPAWLAGQAAYNGPINPREVQTLNKLLLLAVLVLAIVVVITAQQKRFKFEVELEMEPKGVEGGGEG